MDRHPLRAITPFTLLVKSGPQGSVDGAVTLFPKNATEITGVHEVTRQEVAARLSRLKASDNTRRLADGLALIQRALHNMLWDDFRSALDLVSAYIPHVWESEIRQLAESKSWKSAKWAYAGLISNLLQSAHFVVWYSAHEEKLRPGLFCHDWETVFCASVAMDYIRFCQKKGCGAPFIPFPGNEEQECCSSEHSNARRQALWRENHPPKKTRRSTQWKRH